MQILQRKPYTRFDTTHLVDEDGKHALCCKQVAAGKKIRVGTKREQTWTIRNVKKVNPFWLCGRCKARKYKLDNPPPPKKKRETKETREQKDLRDLERWNNG